MAAEFWGESAKDKLERVRHASNQSVMYFEKGPTEEFERVAAKRTPCQTIFHWPLEFPEVIVKRGGFDAFVGNPPFMGGQKISGSFSENYRQFVVDKWAKGPRAAAIFAPFSFSVQINSTSSAASPVSSQRIRLLKVTQERLVWISLLEGGRPSTVLSRHNLGRGKQRRCSLLFATFSMVRGMGVVSWMVQVATSFLVISMRLIGQQIVSLARKQRP